MWTDERVAELKRLWEQGLSASQIAAALGGITRNAVIGKAHRLGLAARPSPIKGPGQPRVPGVPRVRVARVRPKSAMRPDRLARPPQRELPPRPAMPAEPPRPRVFNPNGPACQWPIGEPGHDGFHFCEAPAVQGKPYCEYHCAAAYRRRDDAAA
jgi:GcrA cell cycle regulator